MPAHRAPVHSAAALPGPANCPAQVGVATAKAAGDSCAAKLPTVAAAAAALGAFRPHLWRICARPSCGCLQKALFPEPRLPPRPAPGAR